MLEGMDTAFDTEIEETDIDTFEDEQQMTDIEDDGQADTDDEQPKKEDISVLRKRRMVSDHPADGCLIAARALSATTG